MGLDMYLMKKIWVGVNYEVIVKSTQKDTNDKIKEVILKDVHYVEQEVGYWRKANAIHKWFVDNVQDGKDDCGEYHVSIEQLKNLKELCNIILTSENKNEIAQKLLPTVSGFFFGSTEYDEYYYDDLKSTIKIIDEVIENYDGSKDELIYTSSW